MSSRHIGMMLLMVICGAVAWSEPPEKDLLTQKVESLAKSDPRVDALLRQIESGTPLAKLPRQDWLFDKATPVQTASNVRLFLARRMVEQSLMGEAKELVSGLDPADVVDPASLWFCRAVIHHRLVEREEALQAVEQLLAHPEKCPQRYLAIARLMLPDLQALKEDSLDHIARRMDDVRRRLELGRGGQQVRKIQDGVIESLDRLIKREEESRQQQETAQMPGGRPSGPPAAESKIMKGKGPGDVLQRDIGSKSGWGNISPKQREEALQQIGREFPPHFRELIEQYFRQLATEGNE